MSPAQSVRLVRPAPTAGASWRADADADAVIAHTAGSLRVVGGPGTGKTSVLARAAAARLNAGAEADQVLLLTFSRRSAAALRDAVVAETTVALREVPVRSFESYAWGVLDRARRRHAEWSAPRLITGPEQDAIIRELLSGSLQGEGATSWPDELRAALPTAGFASELRDALMRCTQRGISAQQLAAWAHEHARPVWRSLSSFLTEYAGVTAMRLDDSYDPAELVRAVVDLWKEEPGELHREHGRLRHLYVDGAEELDPAKTELVSMLAGGLRSTVLSGDPDQSVFGFRGADRRGLLDFASESALTLQTDYRRTPGVRAVIDAWGRTMGTQGPAIGILPDDELAPLVAIKTASASREAAEVAGALRERHLVDGVPWNEMCVIVRSIAASMPVIRRAFVAAGVPLDVGLDEPAVGQSAAVRSLVELVRLARTSTPDAAQIEEVLRSPYFRLDALKVRRLRKSLRSAELAANGVRSSSKLLSEAAAGRIRVPADAAAEGLRELVRIVVLLREREASGATGEELLHAAWRETGVEEGWRAESLAGGMRGADADQRLDAMIAAFDIASSLSSRLREASFETIATEIERQELPADRLSRGLRAGETVSVLSANNAKGRHWEIVAVMGVQDGGWPNLVPRNTILRTEELADLAQDIDPVRVDRRAQLLQEERRLFYVAISRARRQLVVSAVEGAGERPSRFFGELCEAGEVEPNRTRVAKQVHRHLSMLDHLAELRACLIDPARDPRDREAATVSLRRLADAGVHGAAPGDWYALREMSTTEPIVAPGERVALSPSAATTFVACPLQWFLGRVGERRRSANAAVGTLVHAAFESVGDPAGRGQAELFNAMWRVVDDRWHELELDSPWEDRKWRASVQAMVDRLAQWLEGREREWVANEAGFSVAIDQADIRGTVDRLERDRATGELYTIDLKTGGPILPAEADRHPQLGLYQLAVEEGGFGESVGSNGAELLFVKNSVAARPQRPLQRDEDPDWARTMVAELTTGMAGGTFAARPGDQCRYCAFEALCPAVREIGEEE